MTQELEVGGRFEVPLQGLRSPVDLRFQVHEAIDPDGMRKYFLQVSSARNLNQSACKDGDLKHLQGEIGCRSQSLLSVNEEIADANGEHATQTQEDDGHLGRINSD